MDTTDLNIFDSVPAHTVEVGDQIIIDGDPIEVKSIDDDRPDPDEILFIGYSHESGDRVEYPVYFADEYDVWGV